MNIGIVDYGAGNLRSVAKALEHCGAQVQMIATAAAVSQIDKIILPGVGAFGQAMSALNAMGLKDALMAYMESGRPFLGICLGMQVLFSGSEESPGIAGLGVFPGEVKRFPRTLKVPHLGWNQVQIESPSPLFKNLPDQAFFYFAHSYYAAPRESTCIRATAEYGDSYTVAIARDNIFGIQFHPEKSQRNGLILLQNYVDL